MNMRLFFIAFIILLANCSLPSAERNVTRDSIVTLYMKSPGYRRAAYNIELNANGRLSTVYGRPYDVSRQGGIGEVINSKSVIIFNDQFESLLQKIGEVKVLKSYTGKIHKGAWKYSLYLNDVKKFELYEGDIKNQPIAVQDLIGGLIKLSPIEMNFDTWQMMTN